MEEPRAPVKQASSRAALEPRDTEDGHRPEQSLEGKESEGLGLHQLLDLRGHSLMNEDLAALGLAAETGGQVGHGTDGAVVPASLETDGSDGGIALRDPHAEGQVVAALLPSRYQALHALAHRYGHTNGALRWVGHGHGNVEEDHHAVAREALQRTLVLEDELAHLRVILAKDSHDLLGLGRLREGGEAAQVEEYYRDLPPVRLEGVVGASRHDELGELGGEEALEPAELLDLAHLLLDALLERPVPLGALVGERLDRVVEILDSEHRLDPSDERRLIDWLGQVLVAARFQARHDVLGIRLGRDQDDRDERQRCVRTEAPADLKPVHLRHHHVEED